MRSLVVGALTVLALVAFEGCRKKTAPQFYDLESRYAVLVANEGEDAYESEELAAIVTGLQGIAPDTVEGPKAAAILATIAAERARLAAEKAAAEKAVVPTVVPTIEHGNSNAGGAPEAANVAPADAGVAREPYGGMPVVEFKSAFGKCMTEVTGSGGKAFTVTDSSFCRHEMKLDDDTKATYFFVNDRLNERRLERTTTVILDAGVQTVEKKVVEPLAPQVPGMPAPEGAPVPAP